MIELTNKIQDQLFNSGIEKQKVFDQISTFVEGVPFVALNSAAVVNKGIVAFTFAEEQELIQFYESKVKRLDVLKFVPASGTASRMFKSLFNFLDQYKPQEETLDEYLDRTNDLEIRAISEGLTKLPFYKIIEDKLPLRIKSDGERLYLFLEELLSENGCNYGFYPKGLLPFHVYDGIPVTPFEEHLKEGALYASSKGKSRIHFTISEQHKAMFAAEFKKVTKKVSENTEVSFRLNYSFQKSSTDTIAVDMNNEPFLNKDGSVLFRPGGHGALIENLNEQDADVIFIKNIDNVAVISDVKEVADSKKTLAGLLLQIQERAFGYAKKLDEGNILDADITAIKAFLQHKLNVRFCDDFDDKTLSEKIEVLKKRVNRPIRIAGMVKNQGEPGGGPFWVDNKKGYATLQIVETAQIDMSNEEQANIVKNATHFNPVDLVCGTKDYKGNKYNLLDFVDPKLGFISHKTQDGRALKALELPGLWNGAMAFWNTIFVEVPLVTFNPVKSVVDLLKDSHQA